YAKGTWSPVPAEAGIGLPQVVNVWFQVLFHSPNRGAFHYFRSRYWFTIGRRVVFSLGGWSRRIQAGFRVSDRTPVPLRKGRRLSPTGLSPAVAQLSRSFG